MSTCATSQGDVLRKTDQYPKLAHLNVGGKKEAYLDALRGLAFLGVLTVHTSFTVPALSPHISHLALYGRFGVQLFFVVSAYTLMLSSRLRTKREDAPTSNFYVRRLFRIAPLYWAGLLFYTLINGITLHRDQGLSYALPPGIGWGQILANLTFIHGLFPTTINSAVPGGWSIGAEMFFYLIFPLLLPKATNIRRAAVLTFLALLLAIIGKHFLLRELSPAWQLKNPITLGNFLTYWFPANLCVFTLGILLFFVIDLQKKYAWFDKPCIRRTVSLSLVAASMILILRLLRYDTFLRLPVQFAFGMAFVLLAWGLSLVPWKVVVNRMFCGLGLISYSCYMWHFFVLKVATLLVIDKAMPWSYANPMLQFCCIWAITLLGTVAAAFFSYRFIETPGIALGRGFLAHRNMGIGAQQSGTSSPWRLSGVLGPINNALPSEGR